MLSFTGNEILAVVIAASFAAGLNVYATVATLGLLSHVHAFQLPPALHLLGAWPVIGVCALLFGLEFFADKIPVFDLIWNALNTFVKVPVATLLSYGAAQHLSPGLQVLSRHWVAPSPWFRTEASSLCAQPSLRLLSLFQI